MPVNRGSRKVPVSPAVMSLSPRCTQQPPQCHLAGPLIPPHPSQARSVVAHSWQEARCQSQAQSCLEVQRAGEGGPGRSPKAQSGGWVAAHLQQGLVLGEMDARPQLQGPRVLLPAQLGRGHGMAAALQGHRLIGHDRDGQLFPEDAGGHWGAWRGPSGTRWDRPPPEQGWPLPAAQVDVLGGRTSPLGWGHPASPPAASGS